MKIKLIFLSVLIALSNVACTTNTTNLLVDDIYKHVFSGDDKESSTAFIALANISLSDESIKKIKDDYRNEKDQTKLYYYEYLLASRTQETEYIDRFIKNSFKHLDVLSQNNTNWISVESPFYKQLSFYSTTNDDALMILFELTHVSDGANLNSVSEDLFDIYKCNPERFSKIAQKGGFSEREILILMEDE